MSVERHKPQSANKALGLSQDAARWLEDPAEAGRALGRECCDRHSSDGIQAWSNVVKELSIVAALQASDHLLGRYDGHSFWCPADASDETWTHFFAPLHTFLCLPALAGVEWWLRRCSARCGKPFHFDKDEQLFASSGQTAYPLLSTVLYLTRGGDTLISDFEAGVKPAAGWHSKRLFKVRAEPGKLLAFPGNRCHAVAAGEEPFDRQSLIMNWWPHRPQGIEPAQWSFALQLDLTTAAPAAIERFDGTIF